MKSWKFPLIRLLILLFWSGMLALLLYLPTFEREELEPTSISIFTWGDILEPELIQQFEKKSGIKVYLNYYASNEELMVKMRATGGRGYDMIIPSDYAVDTMRREGLLKRLDHSKLKLCSKIHPLLLNRKFDPDNSYSIPYLWEVYGMGYNKNFFGNSPPHASWDLIFNSSQIDYRIAMTNDPIDAVSLAGFYLYGPVGQFNQEQIAGIQKLLTEQKQFVEAYADFRGDYLLATKNCAIAVCTSSYIARSMHSLDYIGFLVPEEGSFITIENFAIPEVSNREELVYQFINFMFEPESIRTNVEEYSFFSSCEEAIDLFPGNEFFEKHMRASTYENRPTYLVNKSIPTRTIADLWTNVKLAGEP